MTNNYIKFYGDKLHIITAIESFQIVCCLQFNTRPIKEYSHGQGVIVEYPQMKNFNNFYREGLKKIISEGFKGTLPRIVIPA